MTPFKRLRKLSLWLEFRFSGRPGAFCFSAQWERALTLHGQSPHLEVMSMGQFRTLDLAIEFYDNAEKLEVVGNLRDQLLRAASSIPLNLSEGNAKSSVKEKKRFYQTAYGSLKECQTIMRLLKLDESVLSKKA